MSRLGQSGEERLSSDEVVDKEGLSADEVADEEGLIPVKVVDGGDNEDFNAVLIAPARARDGKGFRDRGREEDVGDGDVESDRSLGLSPEDIVCVVDER
ncbi:hypothetical protein MMC28_008259 [Mycoblastus sanguinarius]|nr:hypothetical protein [Mycoblastus sanguinarius]